MNANRSGPAARFASVATETWRAVLGIGTVVAVVGAVGAVLHVAFPGVRKPPPPPTESELQERAGIACRLAISDRLHDPRSAEFDPPRIARGQSGEFVVLQRVRARNAFGAMRLVSMSCTVGGDGRSVSAVLTLDP